MNEKKEIAQIKEAIGLLTLGILLFGYLLNYDAYLLKPKTSHTQQVAIHAPEISAKAESNDSIQAFSVQTFATQTLATQSYPALNLQAN